MQLACGAVVSVKGDGSGTQFKLGQALHQDRPIPVAGAGSAVRVASSPASWAQAPSAAQYAHISTDGPFRADVASGSDLPSGDLPSRRRIDGTPAYGFRSQELLVSSPTAGAAGEGSRVVTITATGIANNAFVRHGAYTTRVPFSRMNEALQRVIRQGGPGCGPPGGPQAPQPRQEGLRPRPQPAPRPQGRGVSRRPGDRARRRGGSARGTDPPAARVPPQC